MKTCGEWMNEAVGCGVAGLSDEARDRVTAFVLDRLVDDGGFRGRGETVDLYYTSFGYALAFALSLDVDVDAGRSLFTAQPKDLDLVHAVSWIRTHLLLDALADRSRFGVVGEALVRSNFLQNVWRGRVGRRLLKNADSLFQRIEGYRSEDGGIHHEHQGAKAGSAYGAFLASTLYSDLDLAIPKGESILSSIDACRCADGSFANERDADSGVVTATSAAVVVRVLMGGDVEAQCLSWIRGRQSVHGGLTAAEGVEIPDLLSTATGLLALRMAGESLGPLGASSRALADLHWDESGGFFGSVTDPVPDIEYTYYALMILGLNGGSCDCDCC
ncbi:MAG: prenyltransferase/squalene oxidase repeat-containing protein [Planctomycetota bacterium]|jgi:hypothetical protein